MPTSLVTANTALILTLVLDSESQQFFNELRKQHFPSERNFLAAHLTLFHHLPGTEYEVITEHLAQLAAAQSPLALTVSGVRFLGRGVAYTLDCTPLQALHKTLQNTWQPHLTPQDQQKLNPHVTVQNKVDPAVGRALYQELAANFHPFEATGEGLQLWAYRNGPWEELQMFKFQAPAESV